MAALETIALCAWHFTVLAAVLCSCQGLGLLLTRRMRGEYPPIVVSAFAIISGIGVLGTSVLLLGLLASRTPALDNRLLGFGILATVLTGIAAAGFQLTRTRVRNPTPNYRVRLSALELALVLLSMLCAINVVLGALAPDTAQDSLWYHLSVARAWLQWGRVLAWPEVFPSNTALHSSAIYTAVLRVGSEIDCSLVYASQGFLCLGMTGYFAARWYGRTTGLWAWLLSATAMAANCWFVPIHTGSDLTVAMFSSAGLLLGLDTLFHARLNAHLRAHLVLSNLLIGFAVATKLTALGYSLIPWVLICAASAWRLRPVRRAILATLPISILPFALWGVRNLLLGCGNPFFPLLRESWPLAPEFAQLAKYSGVNSLYPLSASGVSQVIAGIPQKLKFASVSGSPGFLLHALAIGCLAARDSKLRAIACIGVLQWLVYFWSSGFSENVRYFAPFFPVAFVAVAALLTRLQNAAPRNSSTISLVAIALLLFYTYARKQWTWSRIPNIDWRYRPILCPQNREAYISSKDYGLINYPLYEWINANAPKNAVILFGESSYPFYVKRRYLWADPDTNLARRLHETNSDSTRLAAYLKKRHVTHVLAYRDTATTTPWADILCPVPASPPKSSLQLYELNSPRSR